MADTTTYWLGECYLLRSRAPFELEAMLSPGVWSPVSWGRWMFDERTRQISAREAATILWYRPPPHRRLDDDRRRHRQ